MYTYPPASSAPGGTQDSATAAVDPASVPVGDDQIDDDRLLEQEPDEEDTARTP